MDARLSAVRDEVDLGRASPHSLVLLFGAASDADQAGDLGTLEQTLLLARAIASQAEKALRPEAERIAAMCEQGIDNARRRVWDDLAPAGQAPAGDGPPVWWDE